MLTRGWYSVGRVVGQHDLVALGGLGFVQRLVCGVAQADGVVEMGNVGDAATEGDGKLVAVGQVAQLREILADGVQHIHRRLAVGVAQYHGELFAAVAPDDVHLAQALLEQARQAFDHAIPDRVAVGVVHVLEVVDVYHRKGQ